MSAPRALECGKYTIGLVDAAPDDDDVGST